MIAMTAEYLIPVHKQKLQPCIITKSVEAVDNDDRHSTWQAKFTIREKVRALKIYRRLSRMVKA